MSCKEISDQDITQEVIKLFENGDFESMGIRDAREHLAEKFECKHDSDDVNRINEIIREVSSTFRKSHNDPTSWNALKNRYKASSCESISDADIANAIIELMNSDDYKNMKWTVKDALDYLSDKFGCMIVNDSPEKYRIVKVVSESSRAFKSRYTDPEGWKDFKNKYNAESIPQRPCGVRRSKKNPDAMTKDELVAEAVSQGLLNKSKAQKTSVAALCFLLGLAPAEVIPPGINKECGPSRASKNHPYVYSSEELRDLIIPRKDEFGLTLAQIRTMTKNELCNRLFGSNLPIPVSAMPVAFSGNCDDYKLSQVKHLAKSFKLSTAGTKVKICDRLNDMFFPKPVVEIKQDDDDQPEPDDSCMTPINPALSIRDHQKIVVRHMMKHRGLLAIAATGTGKTLMAVAAMNCVLNNYPDVKIIFISPLSLIENFEKEMIKFGLDVKSPMIRNRVRLFSKEEFNSHYKNARNAKHCDKTFLIVDEAHNLRSKINLDAKKKTGSTAATIIKCATKAFKVLLLTATPMKNRPSDMINLISMVDGTPHTEAPSVQHFNRYILGDEEAFERYFKCKISMNLGEKGSDYPKRIDQPLTKFVMTSKYYKDYFDVQEAQAQKFLVDLYGDPSKFKLFYSALRRASLSLDGENSPKVQWTFNMLKSEHERGNKSIVYSAWKESGLNMVRRLLDRAKIPYGMITGDISVKNRKFYKTEFNRGKLNILLLSKAGGEGLDLVGTKNVILMESNWNSGDDEQIIGRAIRYKSHAHLPAAERYANW